MVFALSMHSKIERTSVYYYAVLFLCLCTFFRLLLIFLYAKPIDFFAYLDVTQALFNGENPYQTKNLVIDHRALIAPLVLPSQALFFWPFIYLDHTLGGKLFFLINFLFCLGLFYLGFQYTKGLFPGFENLTKKEKQVFVLLGLALFFNLIAVRNTLALGQCTAIVSFLILFSFITTHVFLKGLSLGIGLALKYSIVPLYFLMILRGGYYIACLIAIVFFAACLLYPLLLGFNFFELYTDYFRTLSLWTSSMGGNNFEGGKGFDMVNLDFLKNGSVVIFLKVFFLACASLGLYYLKKHEKVGIYLLLMMSSITMTLFYHRQHDLVLIGLLLILLTFSYAWNRDWLKFGITAFFLVLNLMPYSLEIFEYLGHWIGENSYIYLVEVKEFKDMIPGFGISLLGLTFYSIYLYFTERLFKSKGSHVNE